MNKIIIIGGGASGMLAAIEASKNENNEVLIIERNNKLGKKLLLTGNGKCNYTNLNIDVNKLEKYYNSDFYKNAFSQFDNLALIEYFKNMGIEPRVFERDGMKYVYPLTNKAKDVYYTLYNFILNSNIDIIYNEKVIDIKLEVDKYEVITDKDKYIADKLIISTGGKSYSRTGSDGLMFDVLSKLGYKIIEPVPALCGLESDDKLFKSIESFRCFLKASLYIDNKKVDDSYGEVQFNSYGLSGIPIMNLSRLASRALYEKKSVHFGLDFLVDVLNTEDLEGVKLYLEKRKDILYDTRVTEFLSGLIDYRLSNYIYDMLSIDKNKYIKDITKDELDKFVDILTNMKINIVNTRDFYEAQITSGGVDTSNVDDKTFESKLHKNIYFIGEVLNVDGICGGYNLQFAFGSAYLVGHNI